MSGLNQTEPKFYMGNLTRHKNELKLFQKNYDLSKQEQMKEEKHNGRGVSRLLIFHQRQISGKKFKVPGENPSTGRGGL